jgi:hypothetical protein
MEESIIKRFLVAVALLWHTVLCCRPRLFVALRSKKHQQIRKEVTAPALLALLEAKITASLQSRDDKDAPISDEAVSAAVLQSSKCFSSSDPELRPALLVLTNSVQLIRSSGQTHKLASALSSAAANDATLSREMLYELVAAATAATAAATTAAASPSASASASATGAATKDAAKDWSRLGFQRRDDPTTDFRSMGLLGQQQLCYFSAGNVVAARRICAACVLPSRGFPLALTSISVTAMSMALLKEGRLDCLFVRTDARKEASPSTGTGSEEPLRTSLRKQVRTEMRQQAISDNDFERYLRPYFDAHSQMVALFEEAWHAGTAAPLAAPSAGVAASLPSASAALSAHSQSLMQFPRVYAAYRKTIEDVLDTQMRLPAAEEVRSGCAPRA